MTNKTDHNNTKSRCIFLQPRSSLRLARICADMANPGINAGRWEQICGRAGITNYLSTTEFERICSALWPRVAVSEILSQSEV